MSDSSADVNPESAAEAGSRRRLWRRLQVSDLFTLFLLLALVAGVLELIPANYYLLVPGQSRPVAPMITIPGFAPVHSRGELDMTDVGIYKINHKLEEIWGRLNPSGDLEPAQNVAGNLSEKQYLQQSSVEMTDSIESARIAALEAVGRYRVTCRNVKPQIVEVLSGTPAARVLRPGDFVASVDGHNVCSTTGVSPLVRRLKPGARVHVSILRRRQGKEAAFAVTVHTIAGRRTADGLLPDRHGHLAMLAISMQDGLIPGSVHLPIRIQINPGATVGPSAGLMYTLGIIERLQRRDLTRGCKVAGTGTVDIYGNVGPIGGAKQKIIAARGHGDRYFLVPVEPDNLDPARANRGNITVIPVTSVRGALNSLQHIRACTG